MVMVKEKMERMVHVCERRKGEKKETERMRETEREGANEMIFSSLVMFSAR